MDTDTFVKFKSSKNKFNKNENSPPNIIQEETENQAFAEFKYLEKPTLMYSYTP